MLTHLCRQTHGADDLAWLCPCDTSKCTMASGCPRFSTPTLKNQPHSIEQSQRSMVIIKEGERRVPGGEVLNF